MKEIPDVRFGQDTSEDIDWRSRKLKDEPDDDEELTETPPDVVDMLGFDPLEKE